MKNNAINLDDYELLIEEKPIKMNKSMSEETKKNFNTLMQPCGVLEADFALKSQLSTYSKNQLESITNRIKQCVYNITSNFVEIGFRLWECEHYHYYSELGYDNVCDYAAAELGFKKSSTRNFIRVYDRFCSHKLIQSAAKSQNSSFISGNYTLLSEYKNFSYSQLTELLSLSDEQITVIAPKPEDTIKQLREKKKEFEKAGEKYFEKALIEIFGGKIGFKKQIYEHYIDNKDIGKLAVMIKERYLEVFGKGKTAFFISGCVADWSCDAALSNVVIYSNTYFPNGKCMRWYDVAEKIVHLIEQGTFIEEQVHIDELAEEIAEEIIMTVPKLKTLATDEERPYKISLYKNDIDLILQSLRAANIPQDDYDRIYEIIGKAEL